MHYNAIENHHNLKHDPFKALVTPRPIGWISSLSPDGILNLAPYSFFNSLSANPPCVMYCPNYHKFGMDEHKDSPDHVHALVLEPRL